ncbi:MAG: thiamine phosphate synthase [Acidobacteriaceae bacterium]
MLYAITDRRLYAENEADGRARLVKLAGVWAANGVAFIQLREKDLSARDQVELARAMLGAIHTATPRGLRTPRLLVNGRVDVALAAGAEGVHLPAGPDALTPEEVRSIFAAARRSRSPAISVACHTVEEGKAARQQSPDCILFAPVFEKVIPKNEIASGGRRNSDGAQKLPGVGLSLLQQACRAAAPVPVFALGGVTADNAPDSIRAGAAGVAAIRLLQGPPSVWRGFA